ncbi:ABC transporter ATP-binding protein, partial [bacterium]|nr:ABC transporter ATP-binding protein [bacterium]
MLKIENLAKSFNGTTAVDRISFEIRKGEIFGFLGPNGAGKTTTINMICGLLKPDAGAIHLDGRDMLSGGPALRKNLGVVPQDVALYEELNAVENLRFWGGLYGLKGAPLRRRIDELLEATGLADRAKERVAGYSGGMKRRLNMAAGMVHKPKLLLLDEPTVGIDPQARNHMLGLVRVFAKQGTTILYTTHYLDEAESLCGRLAIIDHGRILASGTQDAIKRIVGENRLLRVTGRFSRAAAERLQKRIKSLTVVSAVENEAVFSLPVALGTGRFLEALTAGGLEIDNVGIKEPSLDSVFIKLTGR